MTHGDDKRTRPTYLLPAGLFLAAISGLAFPGILFWIVFLPVLALWCSAPMAAKIGEAKLTIGAALALVAVVSSALAGSWGGWVPPLLIALYCLVQFIRDPSPLLWDTSADGEPGTPATTDLMNSAADGDVEAVRTQLSAGAEINAQDQVGATALIYAARNGHVAVVAALLAAGADPAVRTSKGSSATDVARRFGHAEVAGLLDGESRLEPGSRRT